MSTLILAKGPPTLNLRAKKWAGALKSYRPWNECAGLAVVTPSIALRKIVVIIGTTY